MSYYLDTVLAVIDGEKSETVQVSGKVYNPNIVKSTAEKRVREIYPEAKTVACVITSHQDLTLEQYTELAGNPSWLIKSANHRYGGI